MTDQYEKPQYEKDVDAYVEADKLYASIEERFMTGHILKELMLDGPSIDEVQEQFRMVIDEMKKLLEDRNTKLTTAKNAMRAAVTLGPNQWRGPTGKPTSLTYGPFTVSSFTRRSLDAGTLLTLAKQRGFETELMALKGFNKNGEEYKLVRTKTEVEYESVLVWLKQHKLDDVVEGAYDEKEGTPVVKGPKPLAFLGEKKDE